ncbi:MAG: LysR family transcriptional regulator [Syntrophobacteraceae bacterium]|nr:LysR family transcriptional regulator [Desulfobacteraceae bacterium]
MRGLNLDHLQTLADVLELGSFSAAARRLNLTQPAVSLQVKQLEARLGIHLVERVGKRAHPTAAALDLLKHIQAIREAVNDAELAMVYHREGGIARVRLGTGSTACIYLLPAVLHDLRYRFPFIEITVHTGNSPDILRSLEENTLDVALITLPAPGKMFEILSTFDDELVALFPGEFPQIPEEVTPSALCDLPLLSYESGGNTRKVVDGWFLRGGLSPKPIMELGSVEAIKRLVHAGLGCAVLPYLAMEGGPDEKTGSEPVARRAELRSPPGTATGDDLRHGLFVRSLTPRLYRRLGVVIRRDKPLGPGLREVVRALTSL